MHISWLGQGCFRIEVKSGNEEVTILTDLFDSEKTGLKLPRTLVADIILKAGSEVKYPLETREGKKPFIIDGPGEYEMKGIFIYAIPLKHDNGGEVLYWIEAENIVLVYTGMLGHVPDESELQEIEGLDVLFVPVGGGAVLDSKKAAELVTELEPRVIIPMMYKIPGLTVNLEGVNPFLKAVGAKAETLPKLKLTRKDLPSEDMKVVVLEKV